MKIEDLIQLLNNRLREFTLSRDYAKMSGDLERMNVADKEIIALGDTLYQLNLLVDTSKSAAVKETTLTEIITDGSVAVLGEYDITPYATDPLHEEKVMTILSKMGVMDTVEKIDNYIKGKYPSSPVTGDMIMTASLAYSVDTRLTMAIMEQDSRFGTAGVAVSTLNPGNVGNTDDGSTVTYGSWQEGVTAVAEWLNRHRISQGVFTEPITTATSTPSTSTSTSTTTNDISTPIINTSTSTSATSTPTTTSTTTTASTTPTTTSSTTATTTPVMSTSTPEIIPVTTTSTTTTATTLPVTDTSTPTTTSSTTITATTTPVIDTSTPETTPVVTSTTTTVTTPVTVIPTEEIAPTIEETATTTAN